MTEKTDEMSPEEKTAAINYDRYKDVDPFPDIPCALLTAADIHNYVRATGMVCPFKSDTLKSASYPANVKGEVRYWTDEGDLEVLDLNGSTGHRSFTLKENSIAFVEVEPYFRLPSYIAIRFNLKISHVYKGLLLGTGPLVDPGFEGKIYIPLHNMTSNEFTIKYDEPLIWVEFTKTSLAVNIGVAHPSSAVKVGRNHPFPESKKRMNLFDYLEKAVGERKVLSSLTSALLSTSKKAETAENAAILIMRIGYVGLLALVFGFGALIFNSFLLQRDYVDKVQRIERALEGSISTDNISVLSNHDIRISNIDGLVLDLRNRLTSQSNSLDRQNGVIEEQKDRLDLLEEENLNQLEEENIQ